MGSKSYVCPPVIAVAKGGLSSARWCAVQLFISRAFFFLAADGPRVGHALEKSLPDSDPGRLQRQRDVRVVNALRRRAGGGLRGRQGPHVRLARRQGPRGQRARACHARQRVPRRQVPAGDLLGRRREAFGEGVGVAAELVHRVRRGERASDACLVGCSFGVGPFVERSVVWSDALGRILYEQHNFRVCRICQPGRLSWCSVLLVGVVVHKFPFNSTATTAARFFCFPSFHIGAAEPHARAPMSAYAVFDTRGELPPLRLTPRTFSSTEASPWWLCHGDR